MSSRRKVSLGALLLVATTLGLLAGGRAAAQTTGRPVIRFLVASAGGFDQRGFVQEYARVLPGSEFRIVSSDRQGTRLEDLQSGEVDLTINASQTAFVAFSGQLETTKERFDQLRAISALGVVPLHLVVGARSGIQSVADLRGRSVNVGVRAGENYRLAQSVLDAFGLHVGTYQPYSLSYADGAAHLIAGKIDAMFVVGSYPGRAVLSVTEKNHGRLVPIDGEPADRLRLNSGFLHAALIPTGTYPGQTKSIRTIGVQNLLLCRRDLDEALVYQLTKQLFVALPRLSSIVSSIRLMDIDQASATSIPLHEGAARYYRERELSR